MNKINLFDLDNAFSSFIDMYINKETGEIIEDYDYHILPKEIQKQYIISPKFTKKDVVEIIDEYIKENNITTYTYNEDDDKDDIIQNFDYWLGDNNLLDNYIEFLRKKEYEIVSEWCKKNNYDYYYEIPARFKKTEEELMDDVIEQVMNMDPERLEYYHDYAPRNNQ